MNDPVYPYPPGVLVRFARDVILAHPRDFHADAKACIENLRLPLRVLEEGNIPQQGPCVITVNHYHRPGFGAQWLTLGIAAVVPVKMHWIMTGEFTHPGKWYGPLAALASRLMLKRIAYVYGFTTMPPMPPRPRDVETRARAVRAVLAYVKRSRDPILGLAPEGYDPPGRALTGPPSGVGRFGLLLARAGLSFIPVGAYEAEARFHLHFGKPYLLSTPDGLSAPEKDDCAARLIMKHIACLLPRHLRGEFA